VEQTVHEFIYQKHSEKQYMAILSASERLFIDKGIENVKLTDIAAECGIMRSTFYRYFKNKEEILWHIMRRHTTNFSHKLEERFETTIGTAYDRYKIFMDILYETFVTDVDVFLFLHSFNDTYQYATSGNETGAYSEVYKTGDYHSGDTVRFLTEKFDDGSLKAGLNPQKTAVMFTYSAMSIVSGMSKQVKTLRIKYGVSPDDVVRLSFDSLLMSIKA